LALPGARTLPPNAGRLHRRPARTLVGRSRTAFILGDGVRDAIDCGTEIDTVLADRIDRVARNREHVQRAPDESPAGLIATVVQAAFAPLTHAT
jgi:hypothetical protein